MYCVNCGSPVSAGLSYCNRCGTSLKDKPESETTAPIAGFLWAITAIAIVGMGIMLGGSLVLKKEANFPVKFIAFFLIFDFLIVLTTEILLIRNLFKLTGGKETTRYITPVQTPPLELRPSAATSFGEAIGSVTEHTTKTLEYARREN